MKKYGVIKACLFCSSEFETRPRFLDYCSQKCKNPLNRGEYDPWNKGIKAFLTKYKVLDGEKTILTKTDE